MYPDRDLKLGIFKRIFGKSTTKLPEDADCWSYADGRLTIDLSRASELSEAGGAIRLEGKNLPKRILVIHGDDGIYHAFTNKCTHGGRRLDPVPCAGTVQCCSVGKSTFDYKGNLLRGSAKENIATYPVETEDGKIIVTINQ